jgi:ATP-binding cassette subfamily B protein
MTTRELEAAVWRLEDLGEAMDQLARAAGIVHEGAPTGSLPHTIAADEAQLEKWVDARAMAMRIDADELRVETGELHAALADAAPALVRLGQGANAHIVAMLRWGRRRVVMLAPGGECVRVRTGALLAAVRGDVDVDTATRVERLLDRAAVRTSRRGKARGVLLDELLASRPVAVGWSLRLRPSTPFVAQLKDAGVLAAGWRMLCAQIMLQALGIAAWWMIGRGALDGQVAGGWIIAWALVLVSAIPARVVGAWAQGTAALGLAISLKRRLLYGALRLAPDDVRHQGSGELLARVIESGAVESLVTSGGLVSVAAVLEVAVAAVVMWVSPGGVPLAVAFGACVVATLALAVLVKRRTVTWTRSRLAMTQDLVERMVGHRTRLAQEPRARWHELEDAQLSTYAEHSASLDRAVTWMQGVTGRAWLFLGVLVISPGFARGTMSAGALAVGIGGLMLGYRAITRLTYGLSALARAQVAWKRAHPLFEAGGREERVGALSWSAGRPVSTPSMLLEVRNVGFRYPGRREPVLRSVGLTLAPGERLLLEGASGSGKSTLAAVLTGLRSPDAGLVLLGGLDRQTLGESAWRRRAAGAPQFHENHILSATLAFNLLMGRGWPARQADLKEAEEICEELGLGPLLKRMPSRLMQMVGETGWQLSHGEKSRVYIARALLQRADVIVLDESFAALDPETLERAMRCVHRRAPALIVIAHP